MALLSRTASRISEAELTGPQPEAFNLFCVALSERTRFAYAVFLLNKVLLQPDQCCHMLSQLHSDGLVCCRTWSSC